MEVWKIIFLSKWVICRFHVNLPGCKIQHSSDNFIQLIVYQSSIKDSDLLIEVQKMPHLNQRPEHRKKWPSSPLRRSVHHYSLHLGALRPEDGDEVWVV